MWKPTRTWFVLAVAVSLGVAAVPENVFARDLDRAYRSWVDRQERRGGLRNLVLHLGWSKAYSAETSDATGTARLDLVGGAISVEVDGAGRGLGDVWLVDNIEGASRSAAPEAGDRMQRLGALSRRGRLDAVLPGDFDIDLVVVTRTGGTPQDAGVLFGAPGLWHRVYTGTGSDGGGGSPPATLASVAVPSFDALVQRGAELFFLETFDGNGRTCGTCHPAEHNFTIDRGFIATLRDDDPLFVAEFEPALAENFEKPALMRELGLILENTDGFASPESNFTMRGVPHTLALPTSLAAADDFPHDEATGWSGDGAPNGGSLRQFANGAIRQHFPRTLGRVDGVDFRFATDEELDAMEAFQLFLGRDEDPDITPGSPTELFFRSRLAERGKAVFNDADTSDGSAGKCVNCHANAGANAAFSGSNDNFDTGVERLPDQPADRIVAEVGDPRLADNPPDDGLGTPGDGSFNTPSLVEAADTPPFFHNNAVETLEEAVAFYAGATFAASPSGQFLASNDANGLGILMDDDDVAAVAALLRVLNALENIRSAEQYAGFVKRHDPRGSGAAELLGIASAECEDAWQVLDEAGLHPVAVEGLRRGGAELARAMRRPRDRDRATGRALAELAMARGRLLVEESAPSVGDRRDGRRSRDTSFDGGRRGSRRSR